MFKKIANDDLVEYNNNKVKSKRKYIDGLEHVDLNLDTLNEHYENKQKLIGIKSNQMVIDIPDIQDYNKDHPIQREDGIALKDDNDFTGSDSKYNRQWMDDQDTRYALVRNHPDFIFLDKVSGFIPIDVTKLFDSENVKTAIQKEKAYELALRHRFSKTKDLDRIKAQKLSTTNDGIKKDENLISDYLKKMRSFQSYVNEYDRTYDMVLPWIQYIMDMKFIEMIIRHYLALKRCESDSSDTESKERNNICFQMLYRMISYQYWDSKITRYTNKARLSGRIIPISNFSDLLKNHILNADSDSLTSNIYKSDITSGSNTAKKSNILNVINTPILKLYSLSNSSSKKDSSHTIDDEEELDTLQKKIQAIVESNIIKFSESYDPFLGLVKRSIKMIKVGELCETVISSMKRIIYWIIYVMNISETFDFDDKTDDEISKLLDSIDESTIETIHESIINELATTSAVDSIFENYINSVISSVRYICEINSISNLEINKFKHDSKSKFLAKIAIDLFKAVDNINTNVVTSSTPIPNKIIYYNHKIISLITFVNEYDKRWIKLDDDIKKFLATTLNTITGLTLVLNPITNDDIAKSVSLKTIFESLLSQHYLYYKIKLLDTIKHYLDLKSLYKRIEKESDDLNSGKVPNESEIFPYIHSIEWLSKPENKGQLRIDKQIGSAISKAYNVVTNNINELKYTTEEELQRNPLYMTTFAEIVAIIYNEIKLNKGGIFYDKDFAKYQKSKYLNQLLFLKDLAKNNGSYSSDFNMSMITSENRMKKNSSPQNAVQFMNEFMKL